MHLFRFYLSPEMLNQNPVKLTGADAHHAINVLRLKTGDPIVVFDGQEVEYSAKIASVKRSELLLDEIAELRRVKHQTPSISLFAALIPGFDSVVETATELGVGKIIPVITERTQIRLSQNAVAKKLERWKRVAVSASMQCGRMTLPVICRTAAFVEAVNDDAQKGLRLIASLEHDSRPIFNILEENRSVDNNVAIFVGPPADFTKEELIVARKAGIIPVRLSSNTLRSETAVLSALAVITSFFYTRP
jgi:16S rRNA (uracil1498-N3)-methyltransferase